MQEIQPKVSNPLGRPKGSKNEITLIKLAMESGFRTRNVEQINRILQGILDDAEAGDEVLGFAQGPEEDRDRVLVDRRRDRTNSRRQGRRGGPLGLRHLARQALSVGLQFVHLVES